MRSSAGTLIMHSFSVGTIYYNFFRTIQNQSKFIWLLIGRKHDGIDNDYNRIDYLHMFISKLIFTSFIPEETATTLTSSTEASPTATTYAAITQTESTGKFKVAHRLPC